MTRRFFSFCSIALVALSLSSCATLQKSSEKKVAPPAQTATNGTTEAPGETKPEEAQATEEASAPHEKTSVDIENQTIGEIIRAEEPNTQSLYDNSRYDFPITMNSKVEGWIDYFTGRGRDHMERYLERSSRYIPAMKETLKAAGLPQDLVYLALIESGFNMRAKSRTRAVGPWQFMKGTGKRYGLRIDAWIDERRDPIRSTEAAAKYLKDLYLMFESWYLAASAYNAGEYKILRAIEELKTNNYWRICETRLLRRETKDYIPKLIAAAIIAKNPAKYGFGNLSYQEPVEYEKVTVDFPVKLSDIAKLVDAPVDDLEDLNPELVRGRVPPTVDSYDVRVPVGSRALVERAIAGLRENEAVADLPLQYSVHPGETLASVARKYRISIRTLANANNLSPKEKLTPGVSLIIPSSGARRAQARMAKVRRHVSAEEAMNESPTVGFITHTVRRGETLWSISEKYDVTIQDIFRWNNLHKSRIMPGKKLRIKARHNAGTEATDSRNHIRHGKSHRYAEYSPNKTKKRIR